MSNFGDSNTEKNKKIASVLAVICFLGYLAYKLFIVWDNNKLGDFPRPEKPKIFDAAKIEAQNEALRKTIVLPDGNTVYYFDEQENKIENPEQATYSRVIYGYDNENNCIVQNFYGDYKKQKKEVSNLMKVEEKQFDLEYLYEKYKY